MLSRIYTSLTLCVKRPSGSLALHVQCSVSAQQVDETTVPAKRKNYFTNPKNCAKKLHKKKNGDNLGKERNKQHSMVKNPQDPWVCRAGNQPATFKACRGKKRANGSALRVYYLCARSRLTSRQGHSFFFPFFSLFLFTRALSHGHEKKLERR